MDGKVGLDSFIGTDLQEILEKFGIVSKQSMCIIHVALLPLTLSRTKSHHDRRQSLSEAFLLTVVSSLP